jgi:hypothetical protein
MLKDLPVHMLWVSGELSRLARLSLASFAAQGFRVTLWSYAPDALSADGADVRDASGVLPAEAGAAENMAYLTSLFRYRVLAEHGGLWADMDLVALGGGTLPDAVRFVASEKRRPFRHAEPTPTGEGLTQVTNCFMCNPAPDPGDLFHRATDAVAGLNPEERTWENAGPHRLARLMLDHPGHGTAILPPETADPVAWWNVPGTFLEERDPPDTPFMHMYATIWARRGVDAEASFPDHSMAGRLWRKYGL